MLNRIFSWVSFIFLMVHAMNVVASEAKTKEYKLDNGLKIVVREDHRAPVVVAQVWYKVGSSDEYTGITGISHALEHMMFKGTPKVPGDGYAQIISKNGGRNNAFTTNDFTAYYAELDASKLALCFELEADRMQNLLIKPEDFKQELKVVMEERRMRIDDNPIQAAYERFSAAANPTGPYRHPVIGWMSDIEQLSTQNLKDWYYNWYGPNNATLVVVGDVDSDKVLELAKKHFGPIAKKAPIESKQFKTIPSLGVTRIHVNLPANVPYLMMGFEAPTVGSLKGKMDLSYEPYALLIVSGILDGGSSSRFAKDMVRGRELAVSASANYDPFKRFQSHFMLSGLPTKNHTMQEIENAFWAHINNLKKDLVSEQELKKVKTQIIAGDVFERDSVQSQANNIGTFESIGLTWKEADDYIQKVKDVTAKQVQDVVKKYFTEDGLTVATLNPQPMMKQGV